MEDEVFEIIDYTSASGWEKLITNIEQTLLRWGIDGESYGIFDESKIIHDCKETNFFRKETLSFNDQSFSFYYYCCPESHKTVGPSIKLKNTSNFVNLSSSFLSEQGSYACPLHTPKHSTENFPLSAINIPKLPLHMRNTKPVHPLHRWTGNSHLLVLKPLESDTGTTSFFSSATSPGVNQETLDMSMGKLLLSACAVAFHVSKCLIPVFIPVGQATRQMYIGFQYDPGSDSQISFHSSPEDESVGCFEYRTRAVVLPNVPSSYGNLQSILKLFEERTNADCLQDNSTDKGVLVSIANSFRIMNQDKKPRYSFLTNRMNPVQIGSKKDPLKSILVTCYFDTLKIDSYLDRCLYVPLDPNTSQNWTISVDLDETMLYESPKRFDSELPPITNFISEYLNSWVECFEQEHEEDKDFGLSSLAMSDSAQDERSLTGRLKQGLMKPMFNRENAPSTSLLRNKSGSIDLSKIESCVEFLFGKQNGHTTNFNPNLEEKSSNVERNQDISDIQNLINKMKSHVSVPVGSFFWHLAYKIVDLNFSLHGPLMSSLLQAFWLEIVNRVRLCWERGNFISFVNTNMKSWAEVNEQQEPLKVELKYPLLHQKLMMINYCIYRKAKAGKYKSNPVLADTDADHSQASPKNSQSTSLQKEDILDTQDNEEEGDEDAHQESMVELSRKVFSSFTPLKFSTITTEDEKNSVPSQSGLVGNPPELHARRMNPPTTQRKLSPVPIQSNFNDINSMVTSWKSEKSWENFSKSEILSSSEPNSTREGSFRLHSRDPSHSHPHGDEGIFSESMEIMDSLSATTTSYQMKNKSNNSNSRDQSILSLGTRSVPDSLQKSFGTAFQKPSEHLISDRVYERKGHKKIAEGLQLLKSGEDMWVPETQEDGFMTEDAIHEQQIIFERLGTSKEAAQLRAKMQSLHLISDMEAFKAANPGCILEDFVRWHSPRDWITDGHGQTGGKLSSRMTEPGNLWQELWKNAKPVPVSEQTMLFDYEKEGEQAVLFLDAVTQHQLMNILQLPIYMIIFDGLMKDETVKHISIIESKLKTAAKQLESISWDHLSVHDTFDLNTFISCVHEIEVLITLVKALESKFPGQYSMIERILINRETKLETLDERLLVQNLLRQSIKNNSSVNATGLPKPYLEEFIITGTKSGISEPITTFSMDQEDKPKLEQIVPTVRKEKHRMYVSLSEKLGMRLVETCSQDAEFH